MNANYLLTADEILLEKIEEILHANSVLYVRLPSQTVNQGRRTTDICEIRCCHGSGVVDLVIEKRRTRTSGDLMLISSRRYKFFRHEESDRLADRLAIILRQHGARDD